MQAVESKWITETNYRPRPVHHPCYVCGDDVRSWNKPDHPPLPHKLVCRPCAPCISTLAEKLQQETEREKRLKHVMCPWCEDEHVIQRKPKAECTTDQAAAYLRHIWRHLRPGRGSLRYFMPKEHRAFYESMKELSREP